MPPGARDARDADSEARAKALLDCVSQVGSSNEAYVISTAMAYLRLAGLMPLERIAAEPGTTTGFVIIGAAEAEIAEAWQVKAAET